jgi:hypothetical protein
MFAASVVALAGLTRPGAAAKPPAISGRSAAAIQLRGFSPNYLISRLAYRIQKLAYGGLTPATRAKLDALANAPDPMRTPYGPGVSIPTDNGAEIEALAGSNPSFAAWEQDEPYTIALLIKGRSGGTGTKHLYRSESSSTGDHILFLTSGTTPNLRHQASGGGTVTIPSSVAIVNDTTWSTIVGTWRPGRLKLYVDGFSRASSTAAAINTSALFGIYRWGWGFSTSQDFNGDVALIACFASSWPPAMVRRWHADPFGFLRPWNEVTALMGSAPPATPPSTGTGVVTFLMG